MASQTNYIAKSNIPDSHPTGYQGELAEADALFQSIGDGAIVTDANGNVSRINQSALDILGIQAEDVLGRWYPDVIVADNESGEPISNIERPIVEVFMTGKPVFRKMYFHCGNGSTVPVAVTVSPVMVDDKPVGAIEIFRDISQEVKLDKAKTEFIAVASHQLRTPATGVKQYINLLLDGYAGELNDIQTKYLQVANESNNRQLRIIDDILKIAAAESGDLVLEKEETDLVKLIQDVLEGHAAKFATRYQKATLVHNGPPEHAYVDYDAFRMVLENLVDNAHKYTPEGKSIVVEITKTKKDLRICVTDEGVGIKKSEIPRLFHKFSRLDNPLSVSSGGTGLGLYWVQQILTLHGFTIEVKSKFGKGTTFTVVL